LAQSKFRFADDNEVITSMLSPLDKISVRTSVAVEQSLILALPCLILALALVVSRRRGKSAGYLISVCLFWAYLFGFASFTVWHPWPLEFRPGGVDLGAVHFVPALFEGGSEFHIKSIQVWGNFLAGMPFGFAFPFVASSKNCNAGRRIAFGLGFAIVPEFAQFLWNAFIDTYASRSVDIDDVWLCFAGTLSGYGILWLLAHLYVRIGFTRGARLPLWNHFHDVLTRVATKPSTQPAPAAPSPRAGTRA
jgi:glycopeptide antibiotics resistance protein